MIKASRYSRLLYRFFLPALGLLAAAAGLQAATLPAGFIEENVGSSWSEPIGIAFGKNGDGTKDRAYVWERGGKVWIVENGVKLSAPLLDISEEVGGWRDYGLSGFALDPNFQTNGHFYVLYVVDRHHLMKHGTPQYNAATNEYYAATIGRITRYTARTADDFRTADPASRKILVGETKSTGFPILHQSHGTGSLVFGTDGTLLASCGDGASYSAMDNGGTAGGSYGTQGLADGIITAAENIGAFRCQLLDSLSGKIIRIDPRTGDGIASNPHYQAGSPRSARSRMWARGLRNPLRFTLKPGTGGHNPAAANPGALFIGDVGWNSAEDLEVADTGGKNFGWPLYEGYSQQAQYWAARPSGMNATDHSPPKSSWRGSARVLASNGTVYQFGASGNPVPGPNFSGNSSTGGVWYQGTDFPADWRNVYFHADYGAGWIKAFDFNGSHFVTRQRAFLSGSPVVCVATHPETGGLYYVGWNDGVKKISYVPSGNRPPVAAAAASHSTGASPLRVQFSSAGSRDPEGQVLTYAWDFGDGTTSTAAHPLKTYTSATARAYTATLTVKDPANNTASATTIVSINNTAPQAAITSPAEGQTFALTGGAVTLPLTASVSDAEHAAATLSYKWETFLVHNTHEHGEPVQTTPAGSAIITPLPPDEEAFYLYKIVLTVTDPLGASTRVERSIFPASTFPAGVAPYAAIGTPAPVVNGPFTVPVTFSENVTGLAAADFVIVNGTAATLTGSGRSYQMTVAPAAAGEITIALPAGRCVDATNVPNAAGLSVSTIYAPPPPNAAPVLAAIAAQSTVRGSAVSLALSASDADGDTLTWSATGLPAGLAINPATGFISGTVSATANASYNASVSVSDGKDSATRTFTWATTAPPNQPPVLAAIAAQSTVRGTAVSLALSASDADGDALTWSATGLPAGLAINATTGLISGTVSATANASYNASVSVSDGKDAASRTFTWATTAPIPANQPPVLAAIAAQSTVRGTAVSLALSASDADGDVLTWSATGLPAGLAIHPNTGLISGTVSATANDSYNASVSVSDGKDSASRTFTWTTTAPTPANQPPVLAAIPVQSHVRGFAISLALSAHDPDGDALSWSAAGLPPGLGINASTGLIAGSISLTAAASYNVTATVSDGQASASRSFIWSTTAPSPGLKAEYYAGDNFGTKKLERVDSAITFYWPDGASPAAGIPHDYFSARWTSKLLPAVSGAHTFWVDCDDGFRLWVNGQLVLDKWNPTPWTHFDLPSATISLEAGKLYDFKAEFQDFFSDALAVVGWSAPGLNKQHIPASRFFLPEPEADLTAPGVTLATASTSVTTDFTVQATFTEPVSGLEAADFQLTNATAGALSGSGTQYTLAISPTASGQVSILLPAGKAADAAGNGNTASNTVSVAYTAPAQNQPPTLASPGPQTAAKGLPVTLPLTASDPDGNALTFTASALPPGLSINPGTGVILGSVAASAASSYASLVTVSDGSLSASISIAWTIIDPPATPEPGLKGEYFAGQDFSTLKLTRIDATPSFYWPDTASPGGGVPGDYFSVRWTGRLKAPATGNWQFFADVDDGIIIKVNGQTLLDHWNKTPATYWGLPSTPIALEKDVFYDFEVDFQDFFSDAYIQLSWAGPGVGQQGLPASALFLPVAAQASGSSQQRLAANASAVETDLPRLEKSLRFTSSEENGLELSFDQRPLFRERVGLQWSSDMATWHDLPRECSLIKGTDDGLERMRVPSLRGTIKSQCARLGLPSSVADKPLFFRVRVL